MKRRKTKIRLRILLGFTSVLFFSYLGTGIIFNMAIRSGSRDGNMILGQYIQGEASSMLGRAGILLFVLTGVMFVVSLVITYFLANSITRPIEKLSQFAINLGKGDFSQNDFQFNETELEALNIALNTSAKQLGEYDMDQKTFFQNASHELRTPLMAIKCYAEGIQFGIMDHQAATDTILEETDKLAELVSDILYLSKLDNITSHSQKDDINLAQLIAARITRQQAVADQVGVNLSHNIKPNLTCYGTEELVARAIDNLISNAIRYARTTVEITAIKYSTTVEIIIADDGPGIEEALMPHVFERFYKGQKGNHGIGLAIVKSIAVGEGGNITAGASDMGGAMFTLTLPI